MSYTPIADIPKIHRELVETFKTHLTYPVAWRQHQLLQVARLCKENADALATAIYSDLGRPALEAYGMEIAPLIERSVLIAQLLPSWMQTEDRVGSAGPTPEWQKGWKPAIRRTPKGVGLIIAPWNYPLILSMQPLLHFIAAGNCCVVKPSEIAPALAAKLAELLPKYLDPKAYRVVCGGVEETTKALEQKWDHVFYTGNSTVGRIVATAAAKHLTPVTLELGGKSPVIIDPQHPDLNLAARRILFGKMSNSGQLCVTPDYVIVPSSLTTTFIDALKRTYIDFYGSEGAALSSPDFSRIVNPAHYKRVTDLLKNSRGRIVMGGKYEERKDSNGKWWGQMEPTAVLLSETEAIDDSLMQGEIFGPVLGLVEIDTSYTNGMNGADAGMGFIDAACRFIESKDNPLVVYTFTEREQVKDYVRENTRSGNCIFNDTFMQLASSEIPFGGLGESGYGRYILRHGFEEFSVIRSELDIPLSAERFFSARYPPYTKDKFDFMSAIMREEVPKSTPEEGLLP